MLNLQNLPRTIELIRAGSIGSEHLNAAAASAVAAFIDGNRVPDGCPVLVMLDQRELPSKEIYRCYIDWQQVVEAIRTMVVRGAPAIGIAGASALALYASEFCYSKTDSCIVDESVRGATFGTESTVKKPDLYIDEFKRVGDAIANARPTAVNLMAEVRRALSVVVDSINEGADQAQVLESLCSFANELVSEDEKKCRKIGEFGASLLQKGSSILTHCNAGSLACAFYGTALGVVYSAAEVGKIKRVYADETRPVLQGARLTVWELSRAGVPVTLICDDMAASVMAKGGIDAVIVGADRIASNGDVANKIGTLGVAILANHFNIPFYVAAPWSSVDLCIENGSEIVIEERDSNEVLDESIDGVDVCNPAFDVTPAALISAIITETGIYSPEELREARV